MTYFDFLRLTLPSFSIASIPVAPPHTSYSTPSLFIPPSLFLSPVPSHFYLMFKCPLKFLSTFIQTLIKKLHFSICTVINMVLKSCSWRKAASNHLFPNSVVKFSDFWHFFSNVFVVLFSRQLSSILRGHLPFFPLNHFPSLSVYFSFPSFSHYSTWCFFPLF